MHSIEDKEIDTFLQQLDKEDRGCIGFNQFMRAIKQMIDPDEEHVHPLGSSGDRHHRPRQRPRSSSWVAPESVRRMIHFG